MLHVTIMDQSGSQYYDCGFHFGQFFSGKIDNTLFVGKNKSYIIWPTTSTHVIRNTQMDKK